MKKTEIEEYWAEKGYRVTSHYGQRIHPITKQASFHTGIDLVKQHMAPIEAFTDGIVKFSDERRGTGFGGYGNVVAIIASDKHLLCYCHLYVRNVSKGDHVKKGDIIGKQGSTGISTGSHLHFEVRSRSEPSNGWGYHIDPTEYMSGKEVEMSEYFDDLPQDHWGAYYADKLARLGILSGRAERKLDPDSPITRIEAAVLIARTLEVLGK